MGGKGRNGRKERDGQGETVEERDGKEEAESEEGGWWPQRLQASSSLSRVCTLGCWESRSPIMTVLPECCCLSLGGRRGEGGQTFTDEDPL